MNFDYIECGDCLELMKDIPDKSIDLIVTDPPYLHEKGGRGKMLLGKSLDRNEFNMKVLSDFKEEDVYKFLNSTKRLMKKPQWYIFCSEKQIVYYLKWCIENAFKYNILTWNKPLSVMNRERYSTNIEYIVRIYGNGCALNKLSLEDNPSYTKYYSKYKTYNQIRGKNKHHPSQKPLELLQEILMVSTVEQDIILDPFMGSGSTPVACVNTGRHYIGFEKEPKYFDIACQRLDEAESKESVSEYVN